MVNVLKLSHDENGVTHLFLPLQLSEGMKDTLMLRANAIVSSCDLQVYNFGVYLGNKA